MLPVRREGAHVQAGVRLQLRRHRHRDEPAADGVASRVSDGKGAEVTRDVAWLNDEVERLRAELEQARKERDECRDALERISGSALGPVGLRKIARAALSGDK